MDAYDTENLPPPSVTDAHTAAETLSRYLTAISGDHLLMGSFRARHADLLSAVAQLGGGKAPISERLTPLPFRGLRMIELSVADNGIPQPTAKRQRPERQKLRWHITIQAFDGESQGLGDPLWKGYAALRTPQRARHDAKRLASPKLRYPLTDAFVATVEAIADAAEQEGKLIGLLYQRPQGDGTLYHDGQILICDDPANGSPTEPLLLNFRRDGVDRIELGPCSPTRSNGKPLAANFVYQSRASASADLFADWATGRLITSHRS